MDESERREVSVEQNGYGRVLPPRAQFIHERVLRRRRLQELALVGALTALSKDNGPSATLCSSQTARKDKKPGPPYGTGVIRLHCLASRPPVLHWGGFVVRMAQSFRYVW